MTVPRLLRIEREPVDAVGAAEPAEIDRERGVAARGEVAVHGLDVLATPPAVLVVREEIDEGRPGPVPRRAEEVGGQAHAVRERDQEVPLDDDPV